MNESINSQTLVTCQHCGKITNIANEPAYKNLRTKLERAEAELVAMRSDLATSNSKRDSAEACVVEMREVIRDNNYHDESHDENPSPDCDVCHALSTQCGVGLLEKVKRLREFVKSVAEVAPEFLDDETGHFSKTCEKLLSDTEGV